MKISHLFYSFGSWTSEQVDLMFNATRVASIYLVGYLSRQALLSSCSIEYQLTCFLYEAVWLKRAVLCFHGSQLSSILTEP